MSHEPLLKWKSWPFADRPYTTIFLLSFLGLLSILLFRITYISWGMPFFYLAGMLLVIGNLLPYFIITEYEIHEQYIQIRYLFIKIDRKYSDFGCFYRDKHGVMLSTFKIPRRLDTFRGQSLRFSKNKEEIETLISILKDKIGKQY